MALLFTVLTLVLGQSAPWDGAVVSHVRPGHPGIRSLMTQGYNESTLFREIVNRLETAPVIVLVRSGRCDGHVQACLQFLAAENGMRTLRVTVNGFENGGGVLLGLIAHELQHADEIAGADAVTDAASFRAFYRAHGRKNSDGFETDAARRVARAVEQEMSRVPR